MESQTLNIVYLPDEATRQKAIELSQKVASQLPVEFVLGQGTIPHITIYQAMFPSKNIEQLKELIREFASKLDSFEIEMKGFKTSLKTFFWWNAVKTNIISKIHNEILAKANPLRENLIPSGLENFQGEKEDEMDLRNYGMIKVGERNEPHITITRLKNPDDKLKAIQILGENEAKFRVDKISLGFLGPHGTVTEIIEEFPLA